MTGALDGTAVTSGRAVARHQRPLGNHGFAVTATGKAGNTTRHTLSVMPATSTGKDAKAARYLGTFVTLARDETLVAGADVRSVLERDGNAVIDSINGTRELPEAVNAR